MHIVQIYAARLAAVACLAAAASPVHAVAADAKSAASGKTQVVARAAGKEITLSDLRLEMARLGLSPVDPDAERMAMESLLNRTLLAKAARDANLHRKPEAMARMYAAQDQALADLYLATASQPAEPTRQEVDDFIAANPTLFAARRAYDFDVLTLETANFDEAVLTPLFDKEADFARLRAVLDKAKASYTLGFVSQSGAAFPAPIREQLGSYGVKDNIVLRGDAHTQIMKITAVRDDAEDSASWGALARRLLLEDGARTRAQALVERLKKAGDVAYYRPSVTPKPQDTASVAE
ncbi:MAG: hypothetical protein KDA46_14105 [Parvularculaceae bacterium]|nr:hypothetical protein [Parvularculaceae bacterium]